MKTEAENPTDILQSFISEAAADRKSSKRLTSNCCLMFGLSSYGEALWPNRVCNETNWNISLAGPWRRSQRQHTLRHSRKQVKRETSKALIISPPLFVRRVDRVPTAAGSSRRFTTGNSCNFCHMCSHHQQSRKLWRGDLHLPRNSPFSYARERRSRHQSDHR